ncbi:Macro domain-containing protein XCC3184 [Linum perenne]
MASSAAGDNTFIAEFPLSASSFLKINKGDITKWFINGSSDSFISCFNEGFLISWCIRCLAIHRAAGPELREACFKVPEVSSGIRCPTGEARITPGFKLPASHVIHTVGPIYDSDPNPGASLKNAYKNSLIVARDNNIEYVAFPAISCGVYGYPFEEAAGVAISTIKELANDFKEVHFVLFADDIYDVWVKKAKELL